MFLLKRNKLNLQSIDFNTYILKNMLLCLISHHNMNNFINIIQYIEMIPYIEKY